MTNITEYTDISTLLTLFQDIRAKILADVSEISEVVVFSSQLDNEDTQRPFAYPYVAVQMTIDWEPSEAHGSVSPAAGAIGLQKKGLAAIIIHTLFGNRKDDTDGFIQNEPIRHKVHRAVDLLENTLFFTKLLKVQDQVPILFNSVQDYMTVYTSNVVEGALIIGTAHDLDEFEVNDISIVD